MALEKRVVRLEQEKDESNAPADVAGLRKGDTAAKAVARTTKALGRPLRRAFVLPAKDAFQGGCDGNH